MPAIRRRRFKRRYKPYTKRRSKFTKRRGVKRRYKSRFSRPRKFRRIERDILKKKQFVHMTHAGIIQIAGSDMVTYSVNPWLVRQFRINSIYDPNYTDSSGNFAASSSGVKFWKNFYTHYTVLSAKITVTLAQVGVNGTSTENMPIMWAIKQDENSAINNSSGHWPQLYTDPKTKYRILRPDQDGGKPQTMTDYCSISKFFNTKDPTSDSSLYANFTSNPTELAFWNIWLEQMDYANAITSSPNYTLEWKIDQYVCLHQPKDIDDFDPDYCVHQAETAV